MVKFIWAQDKRGLIGDNGKLPWSNKAELNYFKNQTTGGVVVMGLTTWKSIGSKPLKNRLNIILTTKDEIDGYDDENVYIANSVEEVLQFEQETDRDVWVIGGARTFKSFEQLCEEAVVSTIEGDYTGNTYYTDLKDKLTEDRVVVILKGEGFTVKHYRLV
jgi:dihydrofolate reductase